MMECVPTKGNKMPDGSGPSDPPIELEAEQLRLSERMKRLEEAIAELEGAANLRADAAARLAKYRQSHERMQFARRTLEWKLQELLPGSEVDRTETPAADEIPEPVRKSRNRKGRGWLRPT